eukprot:15135454-Alexandrium_andersonii.AAC.1
MGRQGAILRSLLRNPVVKTLMKIRSSDKVVRDELSMRQQQTQGGVITGTTMLATEQDEQQPRRESIRNKT